MKNRIANISKLTGYSGEPWSGSVQGILEKNGIICREIKKGERENQTDGECHIFFDIRDRGDIEFTHQLEVHTNYYLTEKDKAKDVSDGLLLEKK